MNLVRYWVKSTNTCISLCNQHCNAQAKSLHYNKLCFSACVATYALYKSGWKKPKKSVLVRCSYLLHGLAQLLDDYIGHPVQDNEN